MNGVKEKSRWPLALLVIAAVVITSGAIIYSYREAPGAIPVTAFSGAGGDIIVAWQDGGGARAQRLDASGQSLWRAGGVSIDGSANNRYAWVSDGRGGAIFTWQEDTGKPLVLGPETFHAGRINESGEVLWGEGVFIGSSIRYPGVAADGAGGAIFAWNEYIPFYRGLHQDILRLRKFDGAGNPLWGDEGIEVVASTPYHPLTEEEQAAGIKGTYARDWPTYSGEFAIVGDGAGGAIVLWEVELTSRSEIVYAQRFDGRGEAVWPERLTVGDGRLSSAGSDGAGGAIVWMWYGGPDSGTVPLEARISLDGKVLSTRILESEVTNVSDGAGGYFRLRTYYDTTTGRPPDRRSVLYVEHEDASGRPTWSGIKVIDPGPGETYTELEYLPDGTGGLIIAWKLMKNSAPLGGVMAQRIDADGALRWGEEGIAVFNNPRLRYQAIGEVLGDGAGGAIFVAAAGTGALYGDMVYAQKLDAEGNRLWGDGVRIDR